MKPAIRRGGVYRVPDHRLTLPPDYDRDPHPQRTVIVISGEAENENEEWPIVMVVPCSSQSSRRTKYCVKLNHGVANVDKKCWARVVAAQPLAKDEIGDFVGQLPADLLEDVYVNWAEYTGQV
ncbi:type II toxin-antitoxin system PemK/MazF family toxin [Nocardiopsis sp. HUAS JQ3]|uniref:type II toxin-antitoxin system PemK/MazF family toxin n=1 Tax=unclassified Nocardiopsis TaxID=2649073 RepID=UPI0023A9D510|nr:type II toxin-antitoxin system PemK/MazF family toxin [Nocardiopsis sp. HUAS JQ3]WDZ88887.1 type II toxin-antitoxin system PemK/MazF family toxin [Nocardiopsis sp. HUAS JQ3]